MKDQETETPLHRDRFGKTEEAVALLGYSDVVNFIKSEGFRTAVASPAFSLEEIFQIDYPIRADPEDKETVRKELLKLHERHRVRGVAAFDDASVLIASSAAEWLGLHHAPPVKAVRHCIRKDEMRRALSHAPELTVPYRSVEHENELARAVDEIGLPCVVKPVDSSNSRLVEFCESKAAAMAAAKAVLEWARQNRRTERVLIEPYLDGQEFSVESFTQNGETTVMAVCEKILGPLPYFVEIGHYSPTRQPKDVERALAEAAKSALKILKIDHLVTHTELRGTEDGIKIIEINPRPAGGKLREFIRTISGYDLHEVAVQMAIGSRPIAWPIRASHGVYHCLTSESEGTVHYNRGYLRNPLSSGLYPAVQLGVRPRERVYPVNHQEGKILGRILAYGAGFKTVHEEISKILRELQFEIVPAAAAHAHGASPGHAATAPASQSAGGAPNSGGANNWGQPFPTAPAWVPGYGWVWLALPGTNGAPAQMQPAPTPKPHEPPGAAPQPEHSPRNRVDFEPSSEGPDKSAGAKGHSSPLQAFRMLTLPDTAGQSGETSCCGNASAPEDAERPATQKTEDGSAEQVRGGAGAWERGCC